MVVLLTLTLLLFSTGCSKKEEANLRLAVSPWIGYSPLYLAQEKGWLKSAGITLIHSTSLHETLHYYEADLIDAFASTQYEATLSNTKNMVHLLAFDRSNGGDVVLSNRSLDTIKKSKKISAFFEIESVNKLVFDNFLKKFNLSNSHFHVINKDQTMIKELSPDTDNDVVIVTYEPYATVLRNRGFTQLSSTRDTEILVLDSLYINKTSFEKYKDKTTALKSIIKRAYRYLETDPKGYYESVKGYLEMPSYEDFNQSLSTIEWLIDKPIEEINSRFKSHKIILME